jgi:hypothetical protein
MSRTMVLGGSLESNPANGMDGSDRLGGVPDRGRGIDGRMRQVTWPLLLTASKSSTK